MGHILASITKNSSRTFLNSIQLGKVWLRRAGLVRSLNTKQEYKKLRDDFHAYPTDAKARRLQEILGTTTPFQEVVAAMDSEFDINFYLALNSDVRASKIDGYFHYLTWGWKENRAPSKFFDPGYYSQHNRDMGQDEFPLAHYVKNGRPNGRPANPISDRLWFEPFVPSDGQWDNVPSALRSADTRAAVIIPVYKGYEETLTSIYQALHSRERGRYSLLVVNDRSPDERLSAKLSELAEAGLFDYHHSSQNRGFVQTINHSLKELSGDLDVVLLNSDAYVFPGWFDRLMRHADADKNVATITPLSNNATICSYPLYDQDNYHALEITPSQLDQIAYLANQGLSVETPTGVGFCFYMRRSAIREIGFLDEDAFKLGYGEENDFCMRAINAGMKNLIIGDVFVYHTGSVSFSASKEENFTRGQINLEYKHPNYSRMVGRHVLADPEHFMRRNLDAARLVAEYSGCVLIVAHKWSGGIDTYLEHLRKDLKAKGQRCVTLRVHDLHYATFDRPEDGGPFIPNLSSIDLRKDWGFLVRTIDALEPSRLHINSFAGLQWPWQRQLMEKLTEFAYPKTFVGHDYSPISYHYQLLRPDNMFVGVPSLAELIEWNSMQDHTGSLDVCEPEERSLVYSRFFAKDVHVEVPSEATRKIYLDKFPSLEISVVAHPDHLPETKEAIRRQDDQRIRIAVVGALGSHKGSDIVAALAMDAKNKQLPIDYHLIGYSDNDPYIKSTGVTIWGRYSSEDEALRTLDVVMPDLFLIPSIWPETFCYTLSMALKKKIPPVVFDLGAQAERVSTIKWGVILPFELSKNPVLLSKELMSLPIDELWTRREILPDRAQS